MNTKKIFSLLLLLATISGGFTRKALAKEKCKKTYRKIGELQEDFRKTMREVFDEIREKLAALKEQKIEDQNEPKAQMPEPAQKMVDTIDCDNPESFEFFYANLSNLKMPIGQLVGLYISAQYQLPEEKVFITEILNCLQKSMARMAATEKANDHKKIVEEVAKHKALLQEKIKQEKMKKEQPK